MYLMQFKAPYAIPFKYIQVHVDTNITPSQFFRETLLPPQSPPVLPLLPGRCHPGACGRWDRQATGNSCGVSWDFHGIQWGFIKLTAMKFDDLMLINLETWDFLNYSAQYARLKTRVTDATGARCLTRLKPRAPWPHRPRAELQNLLQDRWKQMVGDGQGLSALRPSIAMETVSDGNSGDSHGTTNMIWYEMWLNMLEKRKLLKLP